MQPREIKEREREQFPWACMHHQEEEEEEDESYETNALNRKTRRKPHPAHYQSRGALKSSPAPPPWQHPPCTCETNLATGWSGLVCARAASSCRCASSSTAFPASASIWDHSPAKPEAASSKLASAIQASPREVLDAVFGGAMLEGLGASAPASPSPCGSSLEPATKDELSPAVRSILGVFKALLLFLASFLEEALASSSDLRPRCAHKRACSAALA